MLYYLNLFPSALLSASRCTPEVYSISTNISGYLLVTLMPASVKLKYCSAPRCALRIVQNVRWLSARVRNKLSFFHQSTVSVRSWN